MAVGADGVRDLHLRLMVRDVLHEGSFHDGVFQSPADLPVAARPHPYDAVRRLRVPAQLLLDGLWHRLQLQLLEGVAIPAPEVVDLDFIEPGAWITSAGLLYYFFDHTDVAPPNTIHFDMAFLEGDLAGSGQVAICHFTARHDETPGVSPLVFELVDVRDETNQTMPFTHSTGDVIIIDPAIPTEPTTWGEVKTLYRD